MHRSDSKRVKPLQHELSCARPVRGDVLRPQVSGDGRVTVKDSRDGTVPYDLPLKVTDVLLEGPCPLGL